MMNFDDIGAFSTPLWGEDKNRVLFFLAQDTRRDIYSKVKYKFNKTHIQWAFLCRIQAYRDRFYVGVYRDENGKVLRKEDDSAIKGFLAPIEGPFDKAKHISLHDDAFYEKHILGNLHHSYNEFISMLGNGDIEKGKELLREKMDNNEYLLTTEGIEYAREKILETIIKPIKLNTHFKRMGEIGLLIFEDFEPDYIYSFINPEYYDKLLQMKLGAVRVKDWKEFGGGNKKHKGYGRWLNDVPKIFIDYYCQEYEKRNGDSKFLLFDTSTEKYLKQKDFKLNAQRVKLFVPNIIDLYSKYEAAIWGHGLDSNLGGGRSE
ncbi:hypothetical protein BKH46_08760 [Helicobacter sp. 12S02634-8]|uniref:hypothetical protein n=1 Tax=Helicobacter sp. 12S02634-8 TaxID=1476199 RepID=UPI000BA6428B|nr:hypothetical protein [Helicobacter sp. 12S02634-8]PAF46159.1 hypothetical protein BKH46_08760 [Helicobacter sp. 12S02634-8]